MIYYNEVDPVTAVTNINSLQHTAEGLVDREPLTAAYTISNPQADARTLDALTTTANDVALTLATLIKDLKAKNVIP